MTAMNTTTTFDSKVDELLKLDAPLSNVAMPRWQRKEAEQQQQLQQQQQGAAAVTTPMRVSASRPRLTPSKKATTPHVDRFIPSRSALDLEVSHFNLSGGGPVLKDCQSASDNIMTMSPSKVEYQKNMAESLFDGSNKAKILTFKKKAPAPKEGYQNNLRVLYSQNRTTEMGPKKPVRRVAQTPDRVLDAPDLLDNYYTNVLDWSSNNVLAVGLGQAVYLWNATTSSIQHLCTLSSADDYVSSISWIRDGKHVAIGTNNADVQMWDVEALKQVRSMKGHMSRVGCLSWNQYTLSSGSRSGNVHNHDVRIAEHHVATLRGHQQEVCGLKWSPDGSQLASGGNDNLVNIWDASNVITPRHSLNQHQAAVKALAWCPWQSNLLATGGGTADRTIRFWNSGSGACLNSIDTKSQVCSLLWSSNHREIVSSHGFSQNQLIVWKYPTMAKVAELTGHTSRVLHMALSPDGTTIVSGAGDETLRFWKCFASDAKTKTTKKTQLGNTGMMRGMIR